MNRRFKPLIWPAALLIAGGVLALLAEASVRSDATASAFGLLKIVSDLLLLMGGGWGLVALGGVLLKRPER